MTEDEDIWKCSICGEELESRTGAVYHEKYDCEGLKDRSGEERLKHWQSQNGPRSKDVPRSVWGTPSWITQFASPVKRDSRDKIELRGFPAYPRSIFGIGNFIVSGWTGASKIQINNKTNEIIELTEAFGYRRRRIINSDTYDSFEIRGSPNQYLMLFGFLTLWLWGLGLFFIIWSYFRMHWFMIMNFGFKSTTNERIACRIDADNFVNATTFCERFVDGLSRQGGTPPST